MSQPRILVGAIVVIALLFVSPLAGLVVLGVFFVVGLLLWVTEGDRGSRPCPVCGEPVPNGETVCASCGHDFRAAAGGP